MGIVSLCPSTGTSTGPDDRGQQPYMGDGGAMDGLATRAYQAARMMDLMMSLEVGEGGAQAGNARDG